MNEIFIDELEKLKKFTKKTEKRIDQDICLLKNHNNTDTEKYWNYYIREFEKAFNNLINIDDKLRKMLKTEDFKKLNINIMKEYMTTFNFNEEKKELFIKIPRLVKKDINDSIIISDFESAYKNLNPYIIQKIRNCFDKDIKMVFTHYYPKDINKQLIRDNDNYNYKGIINKVIIKFTNCSDRGDLCWFEFRSKLDEIEDCYTEIKLLKRKDD